MSENVVLAVHYKPKVIYPPRHGVLFMVVRMTNGLKVLGKKKRPSRTLGQGRGNED